MTANSRPVLVQNYDGPIFVGNGEGDFLCKACGNVLVDGYDPRRLIGVDIRCYKCREISTTQVWNDVEPLPLALRVIDDSGSFLLNGAVDLTTGENSLTCAQEVERVRRNSGIAPQVGQFELSEQWVGALKEELIFWTGGAFLAELASAERARKNGNKLFMRCPLAWAVDRLAHGLMQKKFDFGGDDVMVIRYIAQWRNLSSSWKHHPLFRSVIGPALCNEYHHTMAMLLCCSYLERSGNSVGITETNKASGPSPDLYLNWSSNQRASIEIKAPNVFHWPNSAPEFGRVEDKVEGQLKEAAKQLTGEAGGVVVIGSNHPDEELTKNIRLAIESLAARGRISSKITLVSAVCAYGTVQAGVDGVNFSMGWNVSVVKNPRYSGVSHFA